MEVAWSFHGSSSCRETVVSERRVGVAANWGGISRNTNLEGNETSLRHVTLLVWARGCPRAAVVVLSCRFCT